MREKRVRERGEQSGCWAKKNLGQWETCSLHRRFDDWNSLAFRSRIALVEIATGKRGYFGEGWSPFSRVRVSTPLPLFSSPLFLCFVISFLARTLLIVEPFFLLVRLFITQSASSIISTNNLAEKDRMTIHLKPSALTCRESSRPVSERESAFSSRN